MNRAERSTSPLPESVIEYLKGCTPQELQQFELLRLDEAAHFQKQLNVTFAELVRISAEALVARVLFEMRQARSLEATTSTARELLAELIPQQPKPLKARKNGSDHAATKS